MVIKISCVFLVWFMVCGLFRFEENQVYYSLFLPHYLLLSASYLSMFAVQFEVFKFPSQPWNSDVRMRWGLSETISPHPSPSSSNLTWIVLSRFLFPVFFCHFSRKYFLLADIIWWKTCGAVGGNKLWLWQSEPDLTLPGSRGQPCKMRRVRSGVTSQGPGQASGCLAGRCPPLAGCWAGSGKISSRQKKLKLQLNIIIEAEAACAHNLLFMQQLRRHCIKHIFIIHNDA